MKLCYAFSLAALGAGLAALAAAPAFAQANYPGEGVEVNQPPPSDRGAEVLLYPGTNVVGVQGPLLQPGDAGDATPIKLIPPDEVKRRKAAAARLAAKRQAAPATVDASVAPSEITPSEITPSEPLVTPPKKKKTAAPVQQATIAPSEPVTFGAPSPPVQTTPVQTTPGPANTVPFSLSPSSPNLVIGAHGKPVESFHAPAQSAPAKTKMASAPAAPLPVEPAVAVATKPHAVATLESSSPPPTTIAASITPVSLTPKADPHKGLSKRSEIVFPEGAVDPTPDTITDLRKLASDLSGALRGTGRVQLEAFGGTRGDKSSDARRLSLKRALAVRALLIESGVPAERIDVRALGGTTDGGTPDRVDVFVRTG